MNIKPRTEEKNDFDKDFFELMNNAVFGKTIENIRKHRYIKLVTTDKRRNQLVSESNYHTTKYFSEILLAIEMNKKMFEFSYDQTKPKKQDRAKLCYMDTDSFVIHIITEDFYEDIADDVEEWFNPSKCDNNRTCAFLPIC